MVIQWKELWFLQTWNLMTCKLTKLCMEKLLQVAELGGSNGQRNFSCMDGHPPDIGKCANSCTLLSLHHGWNISRNLQEASVFLFRSRDSLAEWSHGKDMAICTFSGSKVVVEAWLDHISTLFLFLHFLIMLVHTHSEHLQHQCPSPLSLFNPKLQEQY
jgi:hypothetical protein